MKNNITLQWDNTCTTSEPTSISIQRCKNVGFNNPIAEIEVVVHGFHDGLNPLKSKGWYVDDSVVCNESYSYRILTHKNDQKVASMSTHFIHCVDHMNDIGYPGGDPESVNVYNINCTPVLHIDANRLTGSDPRNNTNITNTSSILRHNLFMERLSITGDPISDICNNTSMKVIAKTSVSVQQHNSTQDVEQSNIFYTVPKNINFSQYTIFAVVYDDYNTPETSNKYSMSPTCSVIWNSNEIEINTPCGTRTTSRKNNNKYKLFMLRVCELKTQCWESDTLIYSRQNNNKTICKWLTNKQYCILPNDGKNINSGLCEYMLFDHAVDSHQCSIVSQYLTNRYSIKTNNLNIRDFNY